MYGLRYCNIPIIMTLFQISCPGFAKLLMNFASHRRFLFCLMSGLTVQITALIKYSFLESSNLNKFWKVDVSFSATSLNPGLSIQPFPSSSLKHQGLTHT